MIIVDPDLASHIPLLTPVRAPYRLIPAPLTPRRERVRRNEHHGVA